MLKYKAHDYKGFCYGSSDYFKYDLRYNKENLKGLNEVIMRISEYFNDPKLRSILEEDHNLNLSNLMPISIIPKIH